MAIMAGINLQDYSLSRIAFATWVCTGLIRFISLQQVEHTCLNRFIITLFPIQDDLFSICSSKHIIYCPWDWCVTNGESGLAPFRLSSCKSFSNIHDIMDNRFNTTPSRKTLYPQPGNMSPWSRPCLQEALRTIMDLTSATGMQPSCCFSTLHSFWAGARSTWGKARANQSPTWFANCTTCSLPTGNVPTDMNRPWRACG